MLGALAGIAILEDDAPEAPSNGRDGSTAGPDAGGPAGGDGPPDTDGTRAGVEWPAFCGDNKHSGHSTSTAPSNNNLLWSNNSASSSNIYCSPTVVDGRVFVGMENGRVVAFNAMTGQVLWNRLLQGGDYGVASSPAYANGHVVVFSNSDDAIYRLNATNGNTNWSYDTGSASYGGGSAAIANGTVWIGSPNRYFYCLDEITGNLRWSYQTGGGVTRSYGVCSTPALDGSRVYFGACDGYLYCFNRDSPTSSPSYIWRTSLLDSIFASPMLQGQFIYCGEGTYNQGEGSVDNYKMYCLWKNNGTIKGYFQANDHIMSTPAYYNNTIYFGSLDNWFYAVYASNMTLKWKVQTGGDIDHSPAVADGKVYFSSRDSDIYCRNADTGAAIWNYNMPQTSWAGCSVANGVVYTACHNDRVYAFGTLDAIPPQVTSTDPLAGALDVPPSSPVVVTFNEAMNPLSITGSSFTLMDAQSQPVAGTVSYQAGPKTLTFTPSSPLAKSATFTATVNTNATDMAGNTLDGDMDGVEEGSPADDHTWSFTTSANNLPELSMGMVTPSRGAVDTQFKYQVVYLDADDEPPSGSGFIEVHIDNDTGHAMTLNTSAPAIFNDGDYANGEAYEYVTALPASGDHSFYFNASDGHDLNTTQLFGGPYIPNIPPVFEELPVQTAVEDIEKVIDLGPHIDDPDTPDGDLVLTERSGSVYVTDITGLNVTVLYPEGILSDDLEFRVFDGLTNRDGDMHVDVTPVNDPPVIAGVTDQEVVAGEDLELDLVPYVSDVDNTLSELTADPGTEHASADWLVLTFNYPRDFGSEEVNLTVSDGDGEGWQIITVTVTTPPAAPEISSIPAQQAVEDIPLRLDLAGYVADIDTAFDQLVIAEDSEHAKIKDGRLVMRYPNGVLSDSITLTVSDDGGSDREATASVQVSVTPVNDAPSLTEPALAPGEGGEDTLYTFTVIYSDEDGSESPTISVVLDGSPATMTLVEGTLTEGALYSYSAYFPAGAHAYSFHADDGTGTPTATNATPTVDFTVSSDGGGGGGDGEAGADGEDGGDGGTDGEDGVDGVDGEDGEDGADGGDDVADGGGGGENGGAGGSGSEGDALEGEDGQGKEGGTATIVAIAMVLAAVVLVVVALLLVMKRKRGGAGAEEDPEGGGEAGVPKAPGPVVKAELVSAHPAGPVRKTAPPAAPAAPPAAARAVPISGDVPTAAARPLGGAAGGQEAPLAAPRAQALRGEERLALPAARVE